MGKIHLERIMDFSLCLHHSFVDNLPMGVAAWGGGKALPFTVLSVDGPGLLSTTRADRLKDSRHVKRRPKKRRHVQNQRFEMKT